MTANLNADAHANQSVHQQSSTSVRSILSLTKLTIGLSCLASATAIVAPDWWVGDLCANLRIQWTFALCCTFAVMLVAKHWKSAIVCMCFAVANSVFIANCAGWFSTDSIAVGQHSPTCISVCTFNVLTSNRNFDAIERQLLACDADVIVIPELSSGLERHLNSRLANVYPYLQVDSRDGGNFGIGLYSRHAFTSADIFCLNGNIPSVEAWLSIADRSYYVVATHTVPPIGKQGFDHRNRHLELLADRIRQVSETSPGTSLIVAGDLNLTPWSPIFTRFCTDAGLQRSNAGIQPTWYRFPAFPFGLALDHVLTSSDLNCHNYEVGDEAGSDHRIVTAKFTIAR